MCNLYSLTKGQDAIRSWFDGIDDNAGTLPPMHGIHPEYHDPVARPGDPDPVAARRRAGWA